MVKPRPRIVQGGKGQWKSLSLDPSVFGAADFDGVLGVEELTGYSTKSKQKSEVKNPKKKRRRKKKVKKETTPVPNTVAEETTETSVETKSEEDHDSNDILTRMASWNGLGVPSILLHALADQSFLAPTKIQALTLPAAIFGQRDILGAAETGSGKTLAFGLPILNGIIEELERRKTEDETDNTGHSLDEEDTNNDSENCDDDEETVGEEDVDEESVEEGDDDEVVEEDDIDEAAEEDNVDLDDDEEDDVDQDDEEDDDDVDQDIDENYGFNGDETDYEEFDSFDGTAQCVKIIDNITSGFPTVGENNFKPKHTPKPLYALILTPTRELAVQISQHLKAAAKYTTISVSVVVGGLSSQKQERLLNRGPEIVIATPGRLWDLIQEGHPHLGQVDTLKYLAIDETDRMLERGHFEELQKLLDRINADEANRKQRQNFIFSATLTLTHAPPRYVALKQGKKKSQKQPTKMTPAQKLEKIMKTVGLSNPKIVDITDGSGVAEMLSEAQIICSMEEKDLYLYYFLQRHPGRTLVFCNSIEAVRRLTQLFTILGCVPWPLHAKMHQKHRLKNLERFIASSTGVLLATDVAARGLDIPNVQHVIHYQLPRTAEGYVHRSGRTARAQQQGLTVVFMEPSEMTTFTRIFHTLGRDPSLPSFPVESKWMTLVKQRVNLARRLDKLELQARRVNAEQGWLDKAVEEMDLAMSDDELPTSYSRESGDKVKKEAAALRQQLSFLLSKPLIPKGFSSKFPTQTGKLVVPSFLGNMSSNSETYKETAVDALKQSVEDEKSEKRKRNCERSKLNKRKKRQRKSEAAEEGSSQIRDEGSDQD